MPMVRLEVPYNIPSASYARVGSCVQQALHETMGVPFAECFQVLTRHEPAALVIDASYLGIRRSEDAMIVQVFLNAGRDPQTKSRFFMALADRLQTDIGMRREDLIVSLVEVSKADWSFGNGEAQLTTTGGLS